MIRNETRSKTLNCVKPLTNTPPYLSITHNALSQNWTQRLLPVNTETYRMIQDEYFISSTICKSKNRMGRAITLQHGITLTLMKKVHLSLFKILKLHFFKRIFHVIYFIWIKKLHENTLKEYKFLHIVKLHLNVSDKK